MMAQQPDDRECVNGNRSAPVFPGTNLPRAACAYLAHTAGGLGIRQIARLRGCPPSTISRQVMRIEARRDDPLLDAALDRTAQAVIAHFDLNSCSEGWAKMIAREKTTQDELDDTTRREARRILRRLCEKDAFLAVSEAMEKAVVLRETVPGAHTRTAVVERDVAHRFALLDWLQLSQPGKIARYIITEAGRSALKRLLEEEHLARMPKTGFAEAPTPFAAQHREEEERRVTGPDGSATRLRYNLAESPLALLGRKRDKHGAPYLSADLIEAGERLREDFEIAQMGPKVAQNWDSFLVPRDRGTVRPGRGPAEGPQAARERVQAAVTSLGPGLSDVVLRVCCFLEGLEAAEKRLGWSARSGKVVLRIALQRLAMHYGIHPAQARSA